MAKFLANYWPWITMLLIGIVGSLLAKLIKGSWKKILFICSVLIVVIIVVSFLLPTQIPEPITPTPNPETTLTPTQTQTPTALPGSLYFFYGTGKKLTQHFQLDKGTYVLRLTHDGKSNFIVQLLDEKLNYIKLLVNEIGAYKDVIVLDVGDKTYGIQPGVRFLDIDADGTWTISVEQTSTITAIPTATPTAPPGSLYFFYGTGKQLSPKFQFDRGTYILRLTHDGKSNFIVHLLDEKLNIVKYLVNEIGAYKDVIVLDVGDNTYGVQPGVKFLDIDADGNWTISIEQTSTPTPTA